MYKYNFIFCWPSFETGLLSAPVCLLCHGTALLSLSAGNTTSNRGEVAKAASGVDALDVTDLTAHPPTAWCRWPWAEAGRIHAGGHGVVETGVEGSEGVGGVKVGSAGQRHHQQHVRWDDDDGCSLNPFPAAAPEPSTAGIRLPKTTHTKHYDICVRVFPTSSSQQTWTTCLLNGMVVCIFAVFLQFGFQTNWNIEKTLSPGKINILNMKGGKTAYLGC